MKERVKTLAIFFFVVIKPKQQCSAPFPCFIIFFSANYLYCLQLPESIIIYAYFTSGRKNGKLFHNETILKLEITEVAQRMELLI